MGPLLLLALAERDGPELVERALEVGPHAEEVGAGRVEVLAAHELVVRHVVRLPAAIARARARGADSGGGGAAARARAFAPTVEGDDETEIYDRRC